MLTVLSLETSCDDSAAAVVCLEGNRIHLLSSRIITQVQEHSRWGGVVPEIASRRHLEALPSLVEEVLSESKHGFSNLDAVAATVAPGLAGSLLIASVTGRTLARFNNLPFLGVHHLEGHLASVLLSEKAPSPPYIVLLVSGGHTELIYVSKQSNFKRLGYSHDDAAGEAFDKVARLLGLPYPGGPEIQKLAESGDSDRFQFPKGKVSRPEGGYYPYAFSFSGLKTAVLRKIEAIQAKEAALPLEDLAASFERSVAEVLVNRSLKCAVDNSVETLVMVGGVAANKRLRKLMNERAQEKNIKVFMAPSAFCTDNAAMIGAAALKRLELKSSFSSIDLGVSPRWPLEKASALYEDIPPF